MTRKLSFSKLTKPEARVAIARDVLKQIRAQKFTIRRGSWAIFRGKDKIVNQEILLSKQPNCTCCALGAAMVSSMRLFNKYQVGILGVSEYDIDKQLIKWFSDNQMCLIEYTFECGAGTKPVYGPNVEKCERFWNRYPMKTERAIAIFKNIIANKGLFKP